MSFTPNKSPILTAGGYEQTAITDAVQTLTAPIGAQMAVIQVEKGAATFTDTTRILRHTSNDAVLPQSDRGQIMGDKDILVLETYAEVKAFQFISAEATKSGNILVQYYTN